jgi:hypothetical protein
MASIKERLESTPSLKGIESCYECVPLDSEKDLHDYYAEIMTFQYASKKKLQSEPLQRCKKCSTRTGSCVLTLIDVVSR